MSTITVNLQEEEWSTPFTHTPGEALRFTINLISGDYDAWTWVDGNLYDACCESRELHITTPGSGVLGVYGYGNTQMEITISGGTWDEYPDEPKEPECFWTNLVGVSQICVVPTPDPEPEPPSGGWVPIEEALPVTAHGAVELFNSRLEGGFYDTYFANIDAGGMGQAPSYVKLEFQNGNMFPLAVNHVGDAGYQDQTEEINSSETPFEHVFFTYPHMELEMLRMNFYVNMDTDGSELFYIDCRIYVWTGDDAPPEVSA